MSTRREQQEALREERLAREQAEQESERRRRIRRLALVGALAAVVVAAAVVISQLGQGNSGAGSLAQTSRQIERQFAGIPQSGITLGDPKAPATVMEFADLQCPYCGGFAREALPTVIDRYVRAKRVKIEFHPVSILGPDSAVAARAAAAASLQNRMWQFTELFYRNQKVENSGYVNDDFIRSMAEATPGLDVQRALAARKSEPVTSLVQSSRNDAARLGVDSTPTFFVRTGGGQPRELQLSALTPEAFSRALDSALRSR